MKHEGIHEYNIVIVWDETWGNSRIYSYNSMLYSYDVEWDMRECNTVIVWDETWGNSMIYSYDVEWNTRECNIVAILDESWGFSMMYSYDNIIFSKESVVTNMSFAQGNTLIGHSLSSNSASICPISSIFLCFHGLRIPMNSASPFLGLY
jgi:hypothetical protein